MFKNCIDFCYQIDTPIDLGKLTLQQRFFIYTQLYKNPFKEICNNFESINLLDYTYDNIPYNSDVIEPKDVLIISSIIHTYDPDGTLLSNSYQLKTDNIFTALYITLFNVLGMDEFYIRICGNCNKYFLTPKQNVVYCSREWDNNTMSKCHCEEIICPSCGNSERFTVWDSINVDVNPETRGKVKTGKLFEYICKNCNNKFNTEYKTLYHDCNNRFMIWYFPKGDEDIEKQIIEIDIPIKEKLRIVKYGKYNLIEKIKIFEDRLDDIIIEVMKSIVFSSIPDEEKNNTIEILYNKLENNTIYFSISNGKGAMLPYKTYMNLLNDYTIEQPKEFVYIDRNNVFKFIIEKIRKRLSPELILYERLQIYLDILLMLSSKNRNDKGSQF